MSAACGRAVHLGLALALVLGCRSRRVDPSAPTTDSAAQRDDTAGAVLDATIPLIDGGARPLAEFRGRRVLLAIGATSDPSFAPILDAVAGLTASAVRPVVVIVAMDPAAEDVPRDVIERDLDVVLGWDPHGALATRLQLRALPAVFVLDRGGRVLLLRQGSTNVHDAGAAIEALATTTDA